MKTLGIIAEYNPLHNGHIHHIKASKEKTTPDGVICIMSGNFVQRGAPAVFNKWTRASHALKNGIDLVIELPLEFSMASAERFAFGGINLLNELDADYISFGTESDEKEIVDAYNQIKKLNNEKLKEALKSGINFAAARQLVLNNSILDKPNNILAIEYLKAIEKTNSKLIPIFIKRQSSEYNSEKIYGKSASAKAIRVAFADGKEISTFVPENTIDTYRYFVDAEKFFPLIKYAIMPKDTKELSEYSEIREGLEYKIKEAVYESETLDELIKNIKSKRYTYSSISRMLFNILLGVKKSNISEKPLYIRVLGANEKGFAILKEIKKKTNLPIITKVASVIKKKEILSQLEKDIFATDIYFMDKKRRVDFTNPPVIF